MTVPAAHETTSVADVLARDLGQKIEEIVKVDQTDEQAVYEELTEYVVTDRLRDQYKGLLRAILDAKSEPHEGIGVWISGFFGSGKSFFAKNVGYVLADRVVLGRRASELFKARAEDNIVSDIIDSLNATIPIDAVMFDVSVERSVKTGTERMAEIMYRVLLRELDYGDDFDIADLEFQLESEGSLDALKQLCQERFGQPWELVRKSASKFTRTSSLLHDIDPAGHPSPDSWANMVAARPAVVTVGGFVERAFDMCARRRPGKALVFIIDEVGQYIARSADKMEDLRAVVEQFGLRGRNRVKQRQAVAPAWIIVTSQEKLEEVVAALDSKRVELAKLQDRFRTHIDLAPADIREVATKRVLAKTKVGEDLLRELYGLHQGQLNTACRLERTARSSSVSEDDFVQFYPFLPHYVELSIDIMSGIRLQPGATRHLGGSNRTIIKQAHEILVSDRTRMAQAALGALVTLDKVFELVEGNLSMEKQKDISDIAARFASDPDDQGWAVRVAKVVALLEFVRDLPRTEKNIAACLVETLTTPAPLGAVTEALRRLEDAQFVRNTEDGWKLQTAQEKNWDSERRSYTDPKPRERNEIIREVLQEIFAEPQLKTLHYRNLRTFRLGVTVNGSALGEAGQIPVAISLADDSGDLAAKLDAARDASRQPTGEQQIFWVCSLNTTIDSLVAELHASRHMIAKYDQLRAQNRITNEEAACLQTERGEAARLQGRLRERLREALRNGQGVFRGVTGEGAELGHTCEETLRRFLADAVPDLYPKLEMGARPLKGTEPEEVLRAADLSGLSRVFYEPPEGLGLVAKEGAKYVPQPAAPVAKEVLDYLRREYSYGNKEPRSGKSLEAKFGGLGYGWELDIVRLVLAVLFRAGAVEVTYGGRRFDSYLDPQSRDPFLKTPAFRSAIFTPVEALPPDELKAAVEAYEALTGATVDVEQNAIAAAVKSWAQAETGFVVPIDAKAHAHKLPVVEELGDYRATLDQITGGSARDCVRMLWSEGAAVRATRDRVHRLAEATTEEALVLVEAARQAVHVMAPVLQAAGEDVSEAGALQVLLASDTFYDALWDIKSKTQALTERYAAHYGAIHAEREQAFAVAIEEVKGREDWAAVSAEVAEPMLRELSSRACADGELLPGGAVCRACKASVAQMRSDLAALSGLKSQVIVRLVKVTKPVRLVRRVRAADVMGSTIESAEELNRALERLREHVLKLIDEGAEVVIE